MEQILLFYLMLMNVYIGILMKLLEIFFVDTLGKRLHVNFLGYSHWFISIIISQMKDHSIPIDQAIYATYIVAKYLDTAIVKAGKTFYKTPLPFIIFYVRTYVR